LNITRAAGFTARLSAYVPIITQQFPTLASASVSLGGFTTVEIGRMLASGKNSLNFDFTIRVFRELPALDFPLQIKEKECYVVVKEHNFNSNTYIMATR
jgi:hypothetical protein